MRFLKKLLPFIITVLFICLVFINLDFKELINILKDFDFRFIFPLIAVILLSGTFRALNYKQLISKTLDVPLKILIPLCLTGSALNILLPARAGDIFRAYFTGKKYNSDKIKLFGTIMLERIFDGLVILSMLILGIFIYNKNPLAQKLCTIGAVIFVGSLIFAFLTVKFNKINTFCNFLICKTTFLPDKIKKCFDSFINFTNKTCNSFIDGFEILLYPKKLLLIILCSCGIWFFEALKYYIIIQGLDCHVSSSIVLFIISFLALACMIPSTSIYIGPYQFAVISAFAIYNINKETALASSFIEQTTVTILTSITAVVFLLKNNISIKDIRKEPLE